MEEGEGGGHPGLPAGEEEVRGPDREPPETGTGTAIYFSILTFGGKLISCTGTQCIILE